MQFKIVDPAAALRKADRVECLEFALAAAAMAVLMAAAYAMSLIAEFGSVGFYLTISFLAAAGSIYRANDAWRQSKLPSLDRTRLEERRAVLLEELEDAPKPRPTSWAERIAKSEV